MPYIPASAAWLQEDQGMRERAKGELLHTMLCFKCSMCFLSQEVVELHMTAA